MRGRAALLLLLACAASTAAAAPDPSAGPPGEAAAVPADLAYDADGEAAARVDAPRPSAAGPLVPQAPGVDAFNIGIDAVHGDSDFILATGWKFSEYRDTISSLGATLFPLTSFTAADLAGLDALILRQPQVSPHYSATEIADIHAFVAAGNGLLAHSEAGSSSSSGRDNWNELLVPYGVVVSASASNPSGHEIHDLVSHQVTDGVTSFGVDYQRRLETITPPALDLTLNGGADDALAVVDNGSACSNVVILSDASLFSNTGGGSDTPLSFANNLELLQNIIRFITCGSTPGPSNRAPMIRCVDPTSPSDPSACSAALACDPRVAVCMDPDGDAVAVVCNPAGPYPVAPATPVQVTCTETATAELLSSEATCSVTVVDSQSPGCNAPAGTTLECDGPGGNDGSAVLAAIGSATASDNCAIASLEAEAPELFAAGCGAGAVTPVTWIATDTAAPPHQGTCVTEVRIQDTLPPSLTPPAPFSLECSETGGVSLARSCELQLFLASATASDVCHRATVAEDAPSFFPADCGGLSTTVTFTATDACDLTGQVSVDVTVDDTTAPDFVTPCALAPAAPQSPGSPLSSRSSSLHVVDCGQTDDLCGSEPVVLEAGLLVSHHEVLGGECELVEETIAVDCGEEIQLELLAPPCPSRPPRSARTALSVNAQGVKVVSGETIELLVTATDSCQNAADCRHDAATLCELPRPEPPACNEPLCGE